ncbi:MAG: tetratricopeptide repeat protein [Planctomycetes bacterium]|nr:tetratricopeptide repeat protein [Planctomycetota bacterium]
MACRELERATFPEEAVATEVNEWVVPVKLNVLKDRELTKRHRVPWTPAFLFVDAEGVEQHRFMGYLPPDEFSAQIHLAAGKDAFAKGDYGAARRRYQDLVDRYGRTDAAPEALYWTGVCDFKLTKDESKIYDRCREVVQRYPGHIWAKKLGFIK